MRGTVRAASAEELASKVEERWPGAMKQHPILDHMVPLVPEVIGVGKIGAEE